METEDVLFKAMVKNIIEESNKSDFKGSIENLKEDPIQLNKFKLYLIVKRPLIFFVFDFRQKLIIRIH